MLERVNSKTRLANLALALIGESPISNIQNQSDAAAINAKAVIDQVILEVQADFPWSELRKTAAPERDEDYEQGITDAFAYRFFMPDDFVRPCRDVRGYVVTDAAGNELRHYFEGGKLYSTAETVHLNYIRESSNPAEWWPWMTQAVYHKLAVLLAPARNKSATLTERLMTVYERIVRPRMRKAASDQRTTEKNVRRRSNRYHNAGRGW